MNTPFNLHNLLTAWQWGPFPIAALVTVLALGYWYLRAEWKLATKGRRWPAQRTVPFLAGLVLIDLALQSPLATFTGSYFQAHVVQHLILMVVAPPLLALGAPSTLLLQTESRKVKSWWLAVLHSRPFAAITNPVLVWFAYFGAMFGFFLTGLVNTAMHDMALMDLCNLAFLFSGTLYWWPMVGLDPIIHWKMGYGARIANLAIGVPFEAFLGIAIMSQHVPIASMYSLPSTHAGGALLWAATELSTFAGTAPVFLQWLRADERAGARADARGEKAARMKAAAANAQVPLGPPARVAPPIGESFRPLLQPGNSSWEAMFRAKAGHVPEAMTSPQHRPDVAAPPPAR
ncbi:MAG TPA: cytochrome c oxidase assembly protein [Acidimicrobiales bacterium]|nr:cytochrome c oxidase assembly protein [Acidimicrobiales bacterium]